MTVESCDQLEEKGGSLSMVNKRDCRIMYEGFRPSGLGIGDFAHVQRDGWFYHASNQIPSLGLVQIDKLLMLWGIRSISLKDSLDSKRRNFNQASNQWNSNQAWNQRDSNQAWNQRNSNQASNQRNSNQTWNQRTFNQALYQRILHIFMTIMLIRWFLLTLTEVFPINQDLYSSLGDFMEGYGSKYSRFVYKVEIFFFAIITFLTHTLAGRWERDAKRIKWLDILSFMDRKRNHQSYGLPEGVATSVWIKGLKNMNYFLPLVAGTLATTLSAIVLQCQLNRMERSRTNLPSFWTKMHFFWLPSFWTTMDIFWLAFLSIHFVAFFLIFDILVHYFDVRTEKLIFDIQQIYKYKDELRESERYNVIWTMLKEFDAICVQLNQTDHFWEYFLLSTLQLGPFAILVGLNNNLLFGTRMESEFHYNMIWILTFFILFLWITFVLSASKVSSRMHQVYLMLNRICLIPVHDSMKVRLEHAVKRFDGLQIGFNCFNMFTVGHEYLYHVALFWGSGYILLLDAGQAQKYANAVVWRRKLKDIARSGMGEN